MDFRIADTFTDSRSMTDPKQFLICQSEADLTSINVMQDENSTVRLFRTVANTQNFEVMTRAKTP